MKTFLRLDIITSHEMFFLLCMRPHDDRDVRSFVLADTVVSTILLVESNSVQVVTQAPAAILKYLNQSWNVFLKYLHSIHAAMSIGC